MLSTVAPLTALPAPATTLVGDFNGDGTSDVARISQTGIWEVGLSQGSYFDMTDWARWGARSNYVAFAAGDFTGDGKDDIVGLNRQGYLLVGVSNGNDFSTQVWGRWSTSVPWVRFVVGDFNGDGKIDVAGLTSRGAWVVGLSTGSGFESSTWTQWGASRNLVNVQVGDFDGNGKTDVAALQSNGSWLIGLSTGGSFGTQTWGDWGPAKGWLDIEAGDFNGDGKTDLAGLTTHGVWQVGLSAGTGFDVTTWDTWGRTSWTDIEVGDFTGDASDDIVGLTPQHIVYVAVSTGSSFSTDVWGFLSNASATGTKLFVGDLTGDRTSDIAAFNATSGVWIGGVSTEDRFDTVVFGVWPLGLDAYPYRGDEIPYATGAPWSANANEAYVTAQSPGLLEDMTFNNRTSYDVYVDNFYGVLRSWVKEADLAGITTDAAMESFLSAHLAAEFAATRSVFAALYPHLTNQTYELLMDMELTHGFLQYHTLNLRTQDLVKTMHLTFGDCSELADVEAALVRAEGIPARIVGLVLNYPTSMGQFVADHQVVYAGGVWLDAESNVAFGVNLADLAEIPATQRLSTLIVHHDVFGFYNWYLSPPVRAQQLAAGLDGGIIVYYYQDYFAGIGQGSSLLYFVPGR